ncbi:MAG TPA: hypothetical protein VFI23_15500 [Rhizomicrobium sp.]|nr:hypothetical protein [Rhizomicrobium sp.]
MTTVTGSGNVFSLWGAFQGTFSVLSSNSTGFVTSTGVTATGTGLTYSTSPGPNGTTLVAITGGTITGVSLDYDDILNHSHEIWTGLNVSGAAAYSALANNDQTGFNNLFFAGDDSFTWSDQPGGTLSGFGGNDTFNISHWGPTPGLPSFSIDGGGGFDTLNITGGTNSTTGIADFNVSNVERINLGAGYNYNIVGNSSLVTSGNTLTVDGSALGASNQLNFRVDTAYITSVFTGNIVLNGGAGNDFFEPGKGSNTFNGGAGTDTVSFASGFNETGRQSYNGPGVTANLSLSGFQNLGGLRGGSASFNSIENLIGTAWSDTLTGDSSDNVLDGGGGSDTLDGGAGNDTLIGGSNSTLIGGSGDDTMSLSTGTADGGPGIDTVILDSNWNTPPYVNISRSGNNVTINTVSGINVTLTNVEFVQFLNKTIDLRAGPQVTTADISASRNQTLAASSLFSVTDPLGSPITEYQLLDTTSDPLSGNFVINGVVQTAGTIIDIPASQLSQVSFVTNKASDTLQIRAFDGVSWSAADNVAWAPFMVTVPDNAPVLTTNTVAAARNQTLAASSLFTVSDPDGDTITRYQLWDATNDPASGYFVVNGQIEPAQTVIDITTAQLAQTTFVTGTLSDNLQIRAFDGIAWSAADNVRWAPFAVTVPNVPPVLTTADKILLHGRSVAASSLFTVSDADGDPIRRYQLWDSTNDPNSGYFVVNGVVQPAWTVIDITAAQLAQTSYVAGIVGDGIQIRAFDGADWSAADNVRWAPFTITVPVNNPPVLSTADTTILHGRSVAASSLFTISDADNDAMTRYQLWDSTNDPNSGYFTVNGVVQPAWTVVDITAAQLAQTSYVAGTVGDNLQIRAFDGADWSAANNVRWAPFTVAVPVNNPPVLTTADKTILHGRSVAASSLFTVSDADNDPITRYQLWDSTNDPNSGHFVVNGVVQSAWTVIDLTAAQLAQTTFVAGTVGDGIQIRASDGLAWSAADTVRWAPFTITVPVNNPPVLTTADKSLTHGQTVAASSLFTVSDPDNDTITRYQLWDSTNDPNSGYFVVNGVIQPAWTVIDITAAQLAQTSFVAGTVGDGIQIRASDGLAWSAADTVRWAPFTVTVPVNHAPVLTTADKVIGHGQSVAASSLFTVSDPDGDSMTRYQLWDSTNDPNSGHFVVNGVAQPAWTVIDITAAQLAQTSFVAGTVGDGIQIRASDGAAWSAADTVRWAPFTVTVPVNHAPVLTTADKVIGHGQSVTLSSLFTVSDADGDTMTRYQLWDSTNDPNSGHFVVNGVAQSAWTVIDITAAQLAQTSFVAGTVGDGIQIRAFDGADWSAADNARWAPFTVTVPVNHAPVLTTADKTITHGQPVAASTLFTVSDPDGDSMTRYQLWDSTNTPNSGYFVVNGQIQPAWTVIDITAAQLAQTSFVAGNPLGTSDGIQIRAFDGAAWSAADNARWAPFTITAG